MIRHPLSLLMPFDRTGVILDTIAIAAGFAATTALGRDLWFEVLITVMFMLLLLTARAILIQRAAKGMDTPFSMLRWWLAIRALDLVFVLAPESDARKALLLLVGVWAKECKKQWKKRYGEATEGA